MCGRFSQAQIAELDRELFKLLRIPAAEPRYNVAPTQEAPVIRVARSGRRRLDLLRWGLIPYWAKERSIGNRLINARAETAAEKPAFRDPFRRRRCAVLADGFYEWKKVARTKQPFLLRRGDGRPFGLAGLWDRWRGGEEPALESFTILTTRPNELLAPIHDRMPVILPPSALDDWLGTGGLAAERIRELLRPYPPEEMTALPVSTFVNNPANDSPLCVTPLDA